MKMTPETLLADGDRLRGASEFEAATAAYEQLLDWSDQRALAYFKIGTVHERQNNKAEAEANYRKALEIFPTFCDALNNLALICAGTARQEEAEAYYREILADNPDYANAHINLGNLLLDSGRGGQARYHFRRSIALLPSSATPWDRLGVCFREIGRLSDAIDCIKSALERDPKLATAWNNLGTCYFVRGEHDAASEAFERALAIDPNQAPAWNNLLLLSNYTSHPRQVSFELHRAYGENLKSRGITPLAPIKTGELRAGLPVRVGMVSNDFRHHAVAYFLLSFLAQIDRRRICLVAYATSPEVDDVTAQLSTAFQEWNSLVGIGDEDAANQIRTDRVDVLIDLGGHTCNSRLPIFAYRPAPVQLSWIGYPNTSGLPEIDYRLTDAFVDPVQEDGSFYTEKLWRLPDCFLCFSPPESAPQVSELPALRNGYITFGSFNALVKISDECIDLWVGCLQSVADSRLTIKSINGLGEVAVRQRLLERFSARGVAPERIAFLPHSRATKDHLTHYHDIDIALDTFPYHGTTTTCEALWMGVPVLSLAGDRHAARVGITLLSNVGLESCIAYSHEEFAGAAVRLAHDHPKLKELRSSLRTRMQASPLMDGKSMAMRFQQAIDGMLSQTVDLAIIGKEASAHMTVDPQISPTGKGGAMAGSRRSLASEQRELMRLVETRQYDQVEATARRLLARYPADLLARKTLSYALVGLHRYDEALPVLRSLSRQLPRDPEVLNNLGIALSAALLYEESVAAFSLALTISPTDPELHCNLGVAYFKQHQWQLAIPSLLKAIEHHPDDYLDAVSVLASSLINAGRVDEAKVCFRELWQSAPANGLALAQLLSCHLRSCDWANFPDELAVLSKLLSTSPTTVGPPFALFSMPGIGMDELRAAADRHVAHTVSAQTFAYAQTWKKLPVSGASRKLRIAYLSADFRAHPVGHAIPAVIEAHDRNQVEVFGYSMGIDDQSACRRRLVAAFDHFADIRTLSAPDAVNLIRADQIDVLIDLQGWTQDSRPDILAMRCATVQVNWLGYPGTMGHPGLADYIVGDRWVTPRQHARFYSEAIAQLPHCYLPFDTTRIVGDAPSRASQGLPDKAFVFCSLNNNYKFNPTVFDLWAQILGRVPGSVLWLSKPSDTAVANLKQEIVRRGIDEERLLFAPRVDSPADHLARIQLADLALDTFPYNSHSSGSETLWGGVPMVTLMGETFAARVGASLLNDIGLGELVAWTPEEYADLVAALASDRERLAEIRARVIAARDSSQQRGMRRFSEVLEKMYGQMVSAIEEGVRTPLYLAEDCNAVGGGVSIDVPPVPIFKGQLSIGVAAYGNVAVTTECLEAIFSSVSGDFELILVDNESPDDMMSLYRETAARHANTRIFQFPKNREYTHAVNCILMHATGERVLFVSNDLFVTPAYIRCLLETMSDPVVGIARGVANFVDNGLPTHNVGYLPDVNSLQKVTEFAEDQYRRCAGMVIDDHHLVGDAFMVSRALLESIGGFDPRYFGYFSDIDFGLRAYGAGFRRVLARGAFAWHVQDANFNYLEDEERKTKLSQRWDRVTSGWRIFRDVWKLDDLPDTWVGTARVPFSELDQQARAQGRVKAEPVDYSDLLVSS